MECEVSLLGCLYLDRCDLGERDVEHVCMLVYMYVYMHIWGTLTILGDRYETGRHNRGGGGVPDTLLDCDVLEAHAAGHQHSHKGYLPGVLVVCVHYVEL